MRLARGFASLAGLVVLLTLTVLLAMLVSRSTEVEAALQRDAVRERALAWNALDEALAALAESWDPTLESFSQWSTGHPIQGMAWESLSGRVNLNTVSPFVLALPGFRETLNGVTVEQFVEKRSLDGPRADFSLYAALVRPEALQAWYTTYSLWNLNTADEVMLEKMTTAHSGPSVGSALRAAVRGFRQDTKRISQEDWARVGGSVGQKLEPLLTLEPELDVNQAPARVLETLLNNPDWKVPQPEDKLNQILSERAANPLTDQRLKDILSLPDGHLLLSYLGTKTRFLGGRVTGHGVLEFVLFLDGSDSSRVAPRILHTNWVHP